jgi:hypothetical protein
VSYDSGDVRAVEKFIDRWTNTDRVFIPRYVGCFDEDIIKSGDTDYVMGRIRTEYLTDSTVTLVLMGTCTHSRRYIDWEIKASLRQGESYLPNGLLAVALPGYRSLHLPERLRLNVNSGYAKFWIYPGSASELADCIEEAYNSSIDRPELIVNPADTWRYNRRCLECGITH